jgi:hypothetical protein
VGNFTTLSVNRAGGQRARRFPSGRMAAVLDQELRSEGENLNRLARRLDTSPRALDDIRSGRIVCLHVNTADRYLIKLGLEYLWHWPPEQGGFSDLY